MIVFKKGMIFRLCFFLHLEVDDSASNGEITSSGVDSLINEVQASLLESMAFAKLLNAGKSDNSKIRFVASSPNTDSN